MGHLGQVGHHGTAGDVPTQCDLERMDCLGRLRRGQDVPEGHELAAAIGNFDADGRLARDGRKDPDVGRGHGVGDVLGQRRDTGHLHPGTELQLVPGNRWTDRAAHQACLDPVGGQRVHQGGTGGVHLGFVDDLGLRPLQQVRRRELPVTRRRAHLHLELLALAGLRGCLGQGDRL